MPRKEKETTAMIKDLNAAGLIKHAVSQYRNSVWSVQKATRACRLTEENRQQNAAVASAVLAVLQ